MYGVRSRTVAAVEELPAESASIPGLLPQESSSVLASLRRFQQSNLVSARLCDSSATEPVLLPNGDSSTCVGSLTRPQLDGRSRASDEAAVDDAYQSLLERIEACRHDAKVTHLHNGATVRCAFGADREESRYFTVRLPRQPTCIAVHLSRISGGFPTLYSSTVEQWPSDECFEMQSDQGYIRYLHRPDDSSVRVSTTFYLCVQGSGQACEFLLHCAVQRRVAHHEAVEESTSFFGYAATRTERANEYRRLNRRGWNRVVTILDTLRNDAGERHRFDERLNSAKWGKLRAKARERERVEALHRAEILKRSTSAGSTRLGCQSVEGQRDERFGMDCVAPGATRGLFPPWDWWKPSRQQECQRMSRQTMERLASPFPIQYLAGVSPQSEYEQ
mmetsp:Transcript_81313/g.226394  ORF Transcript_81313/g.226394 Transcript_81313/m.226394 type:complete len:390 (-) Transcript_81313:50-1219(-)